MRAIAKPAVPRSIRTATPDAAMLTRMAETCRGDLAGQRDHALLLLLAAGLARSAIVALQAEQLQLTELGVALPPSGNDETPQIALLHGPRVQVQLPQPRF